VNSCGACTPSACEDRLATSAFSRVDSLKIRANIGFPAFPGYGKALSATVPGYQIEVPNGLRGK